MCGIAGVVGIEDAPRAVQVVQRMVEALVRRAPDSQGVECWNGAVPGDRRLANFHVSDAGGSR
ncbi:MAG: hypothetical protein DMD41_15605 [Gemmatimonadetes bacterium]|nr:MAG: hypothetical protein DMD41_15605 [Gemmatimonadota bacterium]